MEVTDSVGRLMGVQPEFWEKIVLEAFQLYSVQAGWSGIEKGRTLWWGNIERVERERGQGRLKERREREGGGGEDRGD